MKSVRRHRWLFLLSFFLILIPAVVIWTIAGSDRLFRRAVPIEQRLVSQNESIRTKAQQDLLGLSPEAKKDLTTRLIPALNQSDPRTRKWAVIALALMGPAAQEAIPALLQGVSAGEKDVAQACRVALSEIGAPDPQQLPALIQAVQDSREAVRCEAAATIARMGLAAKTALPALLDDVQQSRELPVCAGSALAALDESLPEVQGQLVSLLTLDSVLARRNAAHALSQIVRLSPLTIDRLLAVLANESDNAVRKLLAKALTLRNPPEQGLIPTLIYCLHRAKNDSVRLASLRILKTNGTSVAAVGPVLWERVKDKSPTVRLEAIRWLGETGPPAKPAASHLLSALSDEDLQVRRAALEALRRTGTRRKDGLHLIGRAQRDPDPLVRCLAVEELVELGAADRVAVPLLIADLSNPEELSRCTVDALGAAGHFNRDVVPALVTVLQGKEPLSKSRAASALMQLGARAREAIPGLIQAQKDQVPGAENALRVIRESAPHSSRSHRNRY